MSAATKTEPQQRTTPDAPPPSGGPRVVVRSISAAREIAFNFNGALNLGFALLKSARLTEAEAIFRELKGHEGAGEANYLQVQNLLDALAGLSHGFYSGVGDIAAPHVHKFGQTNRGCLLCALVKANFPDDSFFDDLDPKGLCMPASLPQT